MMRVRFWGVRGDIAIPGRDTLKFGGNTLCDFTSLIFIVMNINLLLKLTVESIWMRIKPIMMLNELLNWNDLVSMLSGSPMTR